MQIHVIGSRPYDEVRELCHLVKDGQPDVIRKAALQLYGSLPERCVVIGAPSHSGSATYTAAIAEALVSLSREHRDKVVVLSSSLRCFPHPSVCEEKHTDGGNPAAIDIRCFWATNTARELAHSYVKRGFTAVLIDNVIDTCKTAKACLGALWPGTMVAVIGDTGDWKAVENDK